MSMQYARFARKKIVLSVALALGVYGGAVMAQSTVGIAYGTADPGAQVQLTNVSSGQVRTITADNDGRFRAAALVPGNYHISYPQKGQTVTRDITVSAGTGFNLDAGTAVAAASANATQLGSITVQANALPAIDVSSVQTTTTFTADQLKSLPIARNVTAAALLAPGVTRGDSAFGNLASFGGSSVAENSYYVNGFNVTNQFDSLSFAQVPYEAIDSENIQDGAFGPEYGNSTGGVISIQTKQGTNEWKGGIDDTWNPIGLQGSFPTVYKNNGTLQQVNSGNRNYASANSNTPGSPVDFSNRWSAWLGGPLIKDKLFIFALVSQTKTNDQSYSTYIPDGGTNGGGFQQTEEKDPYYLVKLNWNINEDNILEYTGFNDTRHYSTDVYNYGFDANNNPYHFDQQGVYNQKAGGQTNILKYTGYITDSFNVQVQYGKSKNKRINTAVSANGTVESYDGILADAPFAPGCPAISDRRNPVVAGQLAPIQSCAFVPGGSLTSANGEDSRSSGRIDLQWKVGDHELSGGFTRDVTKSNTGTVYEGGALYEYDPLSPTSGASPADNTVTQTVFATGAKVGITQRAEYVQDMWHVTDNFVARLGLRNDQFNNRNGLGQTYLSQGHNLQPRLGVSWDVNGDSSTKLYASAGDYSLPVDAGVAIRGAAASLYRIQTYNYTSIDPTTGVPQGLTPVGDPLYANGETGVTPPAQSVASSGLKPFKQREFILGGQQQLAGWTLGAKAIYRKVLTGIDDVCDFRPIAAYANATYGMALDPNSLSPPGDNPGLPGCYIFNPGSGINLQLPLMAGSSQLYPVHLSAAQLGEPKYKRDYYALQLTAEKNFDDKFYLNISYVWAKSWGNSEGLVDSNIGQADTGTSELFDYPELMTGANGNQPNDRRHTLKAFGAWNITNEWQLGANFVWQSGRPENCYGDAPIDNVIGGYGSGGASAYLYCTAADGTNGHTAPRGSIGTTPNYWQLDLNGSYKPQWAKGVTLRATVFNVFNKHQVLTVNEIQNANYNSDLGIAGSTFNSSTFLTPTGFQPPRYVQLNAEYDFSL